MNYNWIKIGLRLAVTDVDVVMNAIGTDEIGWFTISIVRFDA